MLVLEVEHSGVVILPPTNSSQSDTHHKLANQCNHLDFISKLTSLVPKPKVNLTRFHGVFAPNSKHRTLVTPARRGKKRKIGDLKDAKTDGE